MLVIYYSFGYTKRKDRDEQMSQIKKLAMNTVIFGIGNLGSKLLIFLLIPIYIYFLTPEQLGEADLVVSTVTLFIPLVTLRVAVAVIRFGIKK